MAKLTEDLLARYYDGELSPSAARKVEQLLKESPEYQMSLNKMSRIGNLLRLMNDESLENVSFEGFTDRVAAGIRKKEKPGVFEGFRIWAAEFFEHRQVIWAPSVAIVGAAIALLLMLPILSEPEQPRSPSEKASSDIWMAADDTASRVLSSKIEVVNFGAASGTKYNLPDGRGGSVGVVWIVEKP